ncbi:MAG: NADH-quinone oxidoreductase subunit NuoN [Proteobacteria bacterium]|nr:NADH-quinone oxidoreductase subunit NuoN [Pseudomonadota bacterium]
MSWDFLALQPALPEVFLALSTMALLMLGVFRGDGHTRIISWFAVLVLGLTLLLVLDDLGGTQRAFGDIFIVDAFAQFMKVLVLIGSSFAVVMSLGYIEREKIARFEYPILFLFATLGMMMMISANDLISLYLGLELQSLSLYVIAAFRRDSTRSTEAGLKYFVLGALSSGMLLYGASMVYGFAGTTGFDRLAAVLDAGAVPVGLIVGLVFVIAGLAFKVAAVPFHMWTPDVYEGAPTPVTAFFAVAPKVAAMALFVRVMIDPFGALIVQWQQIIVFISIASMVLAAFAAINQTNIKRLMAYSSIGHVGYMLIGLAAGTQEGISGLIIYLTIYVFMNVGTFACILCMRSHDRMLEGIDDLAGLGRTNPAMAAVLTAFMFSLTGIPPVAGFFGKFFIFRAAINAEMYTLAVIGVLSSVVAAFYYLRIVKIMYFDEPAERFDRPIGREMSLILVGTGLFIVFFFPFISPLLTGAEAAARSLFVG